MSTCFRSFPVRGSLLGTRMRERLCPVPAVTVSAALTPQPKSCVTAPANRLPTAATTTSTADSTSICPAPGERAGEVSPDGLQRLLHRRTGTSTGARLHG